MKQNLRAKMAGEKPRFIILVIFVALAFLLGGGSRHDIISLTILRPLAVMAALYSLFVMQQGDWKKIRFPLILLLTFAAFVGFQLIPLPPSLWSQLPQRNVYMDIYAAAEINAPWLPIALSPSRGLNTLLSLTVPLAALLLFAVQPARRRADILVVVWAAALVSAIWGMAQLAGPSNSALYTYRITNYDLPVGLFANRNHQALLIAIAILLSGWMFGYRASGHRGMTLWRSLGAAAILLFVPFILVTGSRAGLLIGLALLVPAILLAYLSMQQDPGAKNKRLLRAGFATAIGTIIAVFAAAIFFSRSLALDRLLGGAGAENLRVDLLPALGQMVSEYFPVGTGYGAFEYAYRRIETVEMLQPSYINHAHNDWIQFIIEGGAVGAVILAVFIAWFAKAAFRVLRQGISGVSRDKFASLFVIAACAAASISDYPLRVPAIMVVFAFACAILSSSRSRADVA